MNAQTRTTSWFYFVLTVAGVLAFRWSLAEPYVIPSGSMQPTLQIGDHVIVNKAAYHLRIPFTERSVARLGSPKRGDVIVFRDPRDRDTFLIKRLIGLPGDRVSVRDGRISVNGEPARYEAGCSTDSRRESAAGDPPTPQDTACEALPGTASAHAARWVYGGNGPAPDRNFEVPHGHYFFMGDNRDVSSDSRVWGFVPEKNLQGRAVAVLYSLDGLRPELARTARVIE